MNFTDVAPLSLNYISFTTYDNEPASWFYDCQFDGFATELDDEVKWLPPEKRLLLNIVEKAENATMPVNLKEINFSFQIRAIHYKHDQALLKTRLNMKVVSNSFIRSCKILDKWSLWVFLELERSSSSLESCGF